MSERFLFVIDTNAYAGEFERDMCAWITGQVGDCEVGEEQAEEARKEIPPDTLTWFDDHVFQLPDNGCYRPCTVYTTPGWINTGYGGEYPSDTPEEVLLAAYRKGAREYFEPLLKQAEALLPKNPAWSVSVQSYRNRIAEAEALTKVLRYPAYRSVAIYLNERPPEPILNLMKERAKSFKSDRVTCTVTGFRLVTEVITTTEEPV